MNRDSLIYRVWPALLLACFVLISCSPDREEVTAPTVEDESAPTSEAWGVDFVVRENGETRLRMLADYMARYESEDSTMIALSSDDVADPVQVVIYDETGKQSALLTAQNVRFDERERIMIARGNVVVHAEEGNRLETEVLEWSESDREIRSSSFVRIARSDDTWQGYGFRADEDLGKYEITRVTGSIRVRND